MEGKDIKSLLEGLTPQQTATLRRACRGGSDSAEACIEFRPRARWCAVCELVGELVCEIERLRAVNYIIAEHGNQ